MESSKLPYCRSCQGYQRRGTETLKSDLKENSIGNFRDLDRLLIGKNQMLLLRRYNCLYWVNINFITPNFYRFMISILASNPLEHLCVCFAFI